jgi:multisubunit Na+/H+ antiporter MnhB subunit
MFSRGKNGSLSESSVIVDSMAQYVVVSLYLYLKNPDGSLSGGWLLIIVGIVWISSGARLVWRPSLMVGPYRKQFKVRLPVVAVRAIGVGVVIVGLMLSILALSATPGKLY